jgi:hypothetical protein
VFFISRELDAANGVKLDTLDTKLDRVIQTVTDEAQNAASMLERLSSPSRLVLSYSQSTHRRLGDVSSDMSSLKAEVRDLRTLFLGCVSPNSSHSSCNDSNPPTSNLPREKHQATARIASHQKTHRPTPMRRMTLTGTASQIRKSRKCSASLSLGP